MVQEALEAVIYQNNSAIGGSAPAPPTQITFAWDAGGMATIITLASVAKNGSSASAFAENPSAIAKLVVTPRDGGNNPVTDATGTFNIRFTVRIGLLLPEVP